jgi:hypothetical protein
MKMSVLQVSKMIRWRKTNGWKINRSKLPTNTILSIAVAILAAILETTPAQADVIPSSPDPPETPHCIEVVNLEKYPEYQIFARSRSWSRLPIENAYFRDIILEPGMCLHSIRREVIDFYATKKTNLNQIDLTPDSGTGQIKGLKSLQTKLFLGKNTSIPDNTSTPFYTGLIQQKVQITELNGDNFKFKTQQYVYHIDNSWIFLLSFLGALILITILIFRRIRKLSKSFDP